jgi:hypothetical protein
VSNVNCEIYNENCTCQLLQSDIIRKLDCIYETNKVFLQNLTQTQHVSNYIYSKMVELNVRNKLLKNISNSNIRILLA